MPDEDSPADRETVIGLLGPVTVDGREVPGVRAKRLLAALALADGRSLSAARLIDDVWGDDPPKSPNAALHTQVSRLRGLLPGAALHGADGHYRLSGTVTDLETARRLLGEGEVSAARGLWRGVPGDDLGGADLGRELADRAAALQARIDEAAANVAVESGDFVVAEEIGRRRLAADPLDEPAGLLLMRALAGQGRRGEALAVFARLRRVLSAELGAEPGAETIALNTELLSRDTSPPSTRRPPTPVSGLRDPGNELIGRAADLAAIVAAVGDHRVVTVQGPGGVGKTRMANAVGRALADAGSAVYFVPLAAVRSGDDLVVAVAAALGVGESELTSTGRPRVTSGRLADRLADALRGRETVLILDNCEQVIDACAALVDSLVAAESGLAVLTTSRSPLLIPAEQVYRLPVLGVTGDQSAAVELFMQRARAVRPDADLAPTAVRELCERLDGLPLAIELAAACVRTMSVDDIGARIAERFELLRSSDRTAPDRHRTLYAVIDWSWELLDARARSALARLCLFPGGFSSEAAAHVVGLTGFPLDDVLGALADQSLVQVEDSGGRVRYRMLEMVREFGEQRLADSAQTESVVAAMQEWARDLCLQVRRRYDTEADRTLVVDVEREAENLGWVLRRSVDQGPTAWPTIIAVFPVLSAFWSSRGLHPEVQSWGDRVITALPAPPADLGDTEREAWQLSLIAGALHFVPRNVPRSSARARIALRRLRRPDRTFADPAEFLSALLLCRDMNQVYRLIVRGSQRGRPTEVRGVALALRLNMKENGGDLAGALRVSRQIAELPSRPDSFVSAMADMGTASLYSQQGRWREGLALYEASLARFRALGADDDALQVGGYIAAALLQLGDFDGARRRIDAIRRGWHLGDPTPQGDPEGISVMMLVDAEYCRLTGSGSADAYTQAGDVLLARHPLATRDPSSVMTLTTVAAALTLLGEHDLAGRYVRPVIDSVRTAADDLGWFDLPQTGNLALVSGVLRCAADPGDDAAVGLLVLADRLHARHDYPAMHQLFQQRRELAGVDETRWRRALAQFGGLGRQKALAETLRIFGEGLPD
ncbi:BTAD domain-containing putative transcriptional regulator [Gordonia neofelifaecis]|uniref:BTAD domain-containing putative transcriptional regulator n=1 Tax=Gordonia neofelifaecis TaxID=945692 RepID=UPI00031B0930|nr:BTAD domain-containing putative transcriptional regulator [Gordonia neofelifaecis]